VLVGGDTVGTYYTGLQHAQSGLTAGETYIFRYRAYNRQGWSDYSPETSVDAATVPD